MSVRHLLFIAFLIVLYACNNEVPVTYTKDIAPLIIKNCTPCHRKGEAGGFSLTQYADVVKRSALIKFVTKNRFMPPWPADASYTHFNDERVLSETEIDLIARWIDGGCLYGDSAQLPALPAYPEGSYLGKPDVVVHMKQPLFLKGDGKDKFLLMKVPFEIPRDTLVRAIEFVPGNRRLLHHVNGHVLRYEYDAKKELRVGKDVVSVDDYDIIEAYKVLGIPNDDGSFPYLKLSAFNYLPGVLPTIYPEGIGSFRLNRKSMIFLKDIHYGPTTKDTSDDSYFNIFYAKQPLKRGTLEMQLGTLGISPIKPPLVIPADTVMKFTTEVKAPIDMSILTINPHMHLLGKNFLAYALKPNGDTIRLIKISKWDFRWQYFYTFKNPVVIPAGSIIRAEGVYDNTSANPLNPNHPPKAVFEREGSMRTSDEMFQFIITYMPYERGDEQIKLDAGKF